MGTAGTSTTRPRGTKLNRDGPGKVAAAERLQRLFFDHAAAPALTNRLGLGSQDICDAQHLLTVLNGFRVVEAGVDLAEADETTSYTLSTANDVQALKRALRLLGFDSAVDPMPPQVRDQLADFFGYPRPPR